MNSPLEVNRADLSWALGACLPHTGRRELDFIGFSYNGSHLYLYATDGYTVAVGWMPSQSLNISEEEYALSKKEARDLLSFIRPTLKRHQEEMVQLLYVEKEYEGCMDCMGTCGGPASFGPIDCKAPPHGLEHGPSELHVLLPGVQSESEPLSEVYEAQVPGKDFQSVYGVIEKIKRQAVETAHSLPFHPDTFARFAKAARYETDRLNLSPRQSEGFSYGASYITVGDNFEGAIAGLTYQPAVYEENAA
jgi:hypothetical protein